MLSRENFIFTIGYDGPIAVIDRHSKKKYGKLSTRELTSKGLFRAAFSSALYSGNREEITFVAEAYNRLGGDSVLAETDLSALGRLFGVSQVDVKRSILL